MPVIKSINKKVKKTVRKKRNPIDKEILYQKFHGKTANTEYEIDIKDFKTVIEIGNAVAIEYQVKKQTDRTVHVYRHEFKSGAKVFSNGKELLIYGKKIKITDRGIIN